MPFNPLKYSMCFSDTEKLSEISSWHEHIPFAFTIVQLLEPKVIVELGTHKGDSYCAFCQAVDELKLDTACYAVDTWEGDEHSGLYGKEVLEELRTYHDPLYSKFSRLIQSRFDEALNYFSDGSIDLLHIDGLHTYDAVKHDFENWLPKMSRHGVVLIHDTNVRERGFGVWLLWQELKDKYPSFEFKYGHGLGVLAVGENVSSEVLDFIALANTKNVVISDFFSYMGNKISLQYKIQEQSANIFDLEELIEAKDTQIAEIYSEMQDRDTQIAELNGALQNKNVQIAELNGTLNSINQSITWKLVLKYQKVIDKLLPHGKRRRRWYERGIHILKVIANDGIKQAIYEIKEYLRINKKIKTTDFRDHSIESISEYVPISETHIDFTEDDIKLIAFYLPQYHPIPENDKFWGKGFTDWRNVAKAIPQFKGHYQPKLPDELGFYDLRIFDVLKRQTELAKQYGVNGFCFHYYWFNGKKLLEKPLNQFLAHPEINFNFCICWANENWTRRWDGLENEILIAQTHSIENDIAFIKDMEPLFRDPRYIRIDGKPVLIVYRITLLPDPKKTAELWREYCIEQGIGEIYLIAAQGFGFSDPRPYGFDAAVEFPPHTMHNTKKITNGMKILNPKFTGSILDYEEYVKSKTYLQPQEYTLFKTVSPGWDNTARRLNNAAIFFGSNPETYKEWLSNVARLSKKEHAKDERIVFINAWNEWAEGAYLEPDMKYGYGYLQATSEVVQDCRSDYIENRKIIFVSHDAHCHGAQMLSLNIIKLLKNVFHYDIYLMLKSGGRLESEFAKYSTVFNLERDFASREKLEDLVDTLRNKGTDIAICNTVVSGDLIELFYAQDIKTLSLIHELPGVIQQYKMEENANIIAQYADTIIFPSEFVKSKFATLVTLDDNKCKIAPQGLYLKNNFKNRKEDARLALRKLLSIPSDSKIVLAVGYADFRKGPDLFAQIGKNIVDSDSTTYFIWVGNEDKTFTKNIISDIKKFGLKNNIRFVGLQKDVGMFYAGADIYLMTSREDPFPSTILEAMDMEVPVIGFDGAGGFKDIITKNTGILVPYLDIDEMTNATTLLLNDDTLRDDLGKNAAELISRKYNFADYVYLLLTLLRHEYKKVSVVIPNYNYGRYLDERFNTIIDQNYPVYEIIFLDDCSSDNSIEIAKKYASNCTIPIEIISNDVNSGSVSKQWAKGIATARGDYVWIAEADDLCEKSFLQKVMAGFIDDNVVLSYSQSKQIDEDGHLIDSDYLKYTNEINENKWIKKYSREGIQEICDTLAVKNTIPNVSAVVFKKYEISEILDEIIQYKIAGDWFFYVWLLQKGNISFNPESLNCHRRHDKGVTISENTQKHFDEILKMQEYIRDNFDISDTTINKVQSYRNYLRDYLHVESY